jgi:hypothetical protein
MGYLMKYIAIIAILFLALQGRTHTKSCVTSIIDTSRYAVIKYNKDRDKYHRFDNDSKAATLSPTDIIKIEDLINKKVAEYNRLKKKGVFPLVIKHPEKYYKQIIAVINSKSEKEAWISCSCSVDNKSNWKKDIILTMDGGSCYFQLKVNLSKNSISDFIVNGVA